jgi:hypothetical protein
MIELAVNDVMADFHIFQNVRQAEAGHAGGPTDRLQTEMNQQSADLFEAVFHFDQCFQVGRVFVAHPAFDIGADGVQTLLQFIELCSGEVRFCRSSCLACAPW